MVAAIPFWQTTGENNVAKKENCTQPPNCTPYGHILLLFTTISMKKNQLRIIKESTKLKALCHSNKASTQQ